MKKANSLYSRAGTPIVARPGAPVKARITNIGRYATRNIFLAVEPMADTARRRYTARRTKPDFVQFIGRSEKVMQEHRRFTW